MIVSSQYKQKMQDLDFALETYKDSLLARYKRIEYENRIIDKLMECRFIKRIQKKDLSFNDKPILTTLINKIYD